jgi:hypothetical protein
VVSGKHHDWMIAPSDIRHATLMVSGHLLFEMRDENEETWQAEQTFQVCST